MGKNKSAQKQPPPKAVSDSEASESDYSSDSTIEDEDGAELTPAMDAAILRTLAKIRRKDGVYSGENIIQTELAAAQERAAAVGLTGPTASRKTAPKPFLLKDAHRVNVLEGVQSDDEDEYDYEAGRYRNQPMTNVEMERRARADALKAFGDFGGDDSDDDEGEFLAKREHGQDETAAEGEAYRKFLLEMGGGEEEVRRALGMADQPNTDFREDAEDEEDEEVKEEKESKKSKKDKKKKAKEAASADAVEGAKAARYAKRAQADEDFLMDYILNRGWIDQEKDTVPTYDQIVGHPRGGDDSDGGDNSGDDEDGDDNDDTPWGAIDDEDEFDDRAEAFETEYNFRFEEPGSSTIITHPREIPSLVRREDDARKLKREARAERKEAEKAAAEEKTRRLKGEKRREIEKQLAALREELGDGVDWEQMEKIMDGDFDEDEWERVVGTMLAAKAEEDDEKPEWDDDDMGDYGDGEEYPEDDDGWVEPKPWEEVEGGEAYEGEEEEEYDEGPINMDADFVGLEDQPKKSKKDKKKDKKRREAEAAAAAEDTSKLSVADRAAKVKAAAGELAALHGEDQIGDLRTRFKYTKSAPVSFGLSAADILMATDAELNGIVGVKMLAPYRRGGFGMAARGLGSRIRDFKGRIAQRKWGDEMPVEDKKAKARNKNKKPAPGLGANAVPLGEGKSSAKRLGKKQRERLKAGEGGGATEEGAAAAPVEKKRKRDEDEAPVSAPVAVDAPGGDSEGKKKRRKKKKGGDAA